MPRLETSSGWSRFTVDVRALFSPSTGSLSDRASILKTLLLRSVRVSLANSPSSTAPILPLRIRPAFVILNVLDLIFLGILGFHPRGQTWIRINDKILHFVCFFLATAMFYMIWDVDEPARASYVWRNASLILTAITCFLVGGIGSEIVQSLLPYKQFQIGDIIANLLGSSLGLFFSYHLERRYRARRELERLYAPLDIEDYGDLDEYEADEDEEPNHSQPSANTIGGAPRSSLKSNSSSSKSAGGKKKARFDDNNIWDDNVEIDTAPSSTRAINHSKVTVGDGADPLNVSSSSSSSGRTAAGEATKRKEDLFSIDDDESDDEQQQQEAVKGADGSGRDEISEETNAWKQADS